MGYGFGGHIGLGKETSWGSGTTITDYVEALSEDVSLSIERFSHKAIIATLAEPDDTAALRRVAGSMQFAAHPVSVGYFLRGALQTTSKATIVGSMNTSYFFSTKTGDDFSSDAPLQPYTFEIFRDTTSAFRYTGCLIDSLAFTINPNQALMCEASIIGRGSGIVAKTTPTFPGSPSKPFSFDTASLSIGGSGTALVEALTIEINNNLEGFGALNLSTDIAKVRRTDHQMVTLRGTLDFANLTEYAAFAAQTEQRMTLSFLQASSFQIIFDMPRVVYTAFPTGIPGRERITADFEGKAFYSQGSGTAIKVTLTTVSSVF